MSNKPASTKRSGKKTVLLSVIITAIILLGGLFFCLVDFKPITTVSPATEKQDGMVLMVYGMKLMSTMRQAAKDKAATEFTLQIPQDALNALLNTAVRTWESRKKAQDPLFYAQAKNGILRIKVSQKKAFGYLNGEILCVPSIQAQQLNIQVKQSSVGKLPLPNSAVQEAIAQALQKYSTDKRYKLVMQAVKSASFQPDGSLEIVFDKVTAPMVIMELL